MNKRILILTDQESNIKGTFVWQHIENLKDINDSILEKGIEKELFYEVIVKGTNITRAIDKVSITYDVDVSTIWKNYYPKIKEDIKNLENLMKSSEILV